MHHGCVRSRQRRREGSGGVVADIAKLSVGREEYYTRELFRYAARSARNRASPWSLVGSSRVGLSGIGHHPAFLGSRWKPASAVGALELAAVGPAGPLLGQPSGVFGAAGDGNHPPLRRQPALGIQLHHSAVAQRLDLLRPTQPHPLLHLGAAPGGELTRVEGREHRIQRRRGPQATPLAGGGDGPLANHLWVALGHAEAVPPEGFRSDGQVVPSSAAAALTLPSRLAKAKARSASTRSTRNRLGCQPRDLEGSRKTRLIA